MGHPMAKKGIRKRGEKFFKRQDRRFDRRFDRMIEQSIPRPQQDVNLNLEDEEDGFDEYRDNMDTL